MKSLLILATLILIPFAVDAQVKNPDLPNPRIKIKYDRFSNLTTASVYIDLKTPNTGDGVIALTIAGNVEGEDLTKTSSLRVAIIASSRSGEWRYLKVPTLLQLILDGKDRLTLGEMKRVNSEVVRGGGGVLEQLMMETSLAPIDRISKSSKVELRIGLDEFELEPSQIADLRVWIRKFQQSQ